MTEKTDNETTATLYQDCIEKPGENTTVEGSGAPQMDTAQSEEVLPDSAEKKKNAKHAKSSE